MAVSASRAAAGVLLGILCAACTDPVVHVRLEIPEAYRAAVASVSLDVLVPPVAASFTCDDIAFQKVPPETVANSLVRQVAASEGRRIRLDGVPRVGTKLFYARGLDQQGTTVVAACAEVGDIEGSVDVSLMGEPTTRAVVDPVPLGVPLPDSIGVTVTDFELERLGQVAFQWTVVGPGGETLAGEGTTDQDGRATIRPGTLSLPGPRALDVRVRWSLTDVSTRLGFVTPPDMLTGTLPGEPSDRLRASTEALYRVGRIGPAGEMGFMALGPMSTVGLGRGLLIAYYEAAGGGTFRTITTAVPANSVLTLGMYSAADRDHVVIISGEKWLEVKPDGSFIERPGPGKPARRIVNIGPCEGTGDDVLLASLVDDSYGVFTTTGMPTTSPVVATPPAARLIDSGCVSSTSGVHRTVVFGALGGGLSLIADMDVVRSGRWQTFQAGVGFSPEVGADPAYMLGTQVDIEGTALARFALMPVAAAGLTPALVDSDPSATLVRSSGGGDFDKDDTLDIVALLDFGSADGITQFRVMFSLGAEHLGARLVGLSAEEEGDEPRLFVADFDQDGYSDVLVATQTGFRILDMGPAAN